MTQVPQTYEIEYITGEDSFGRSGNPGYIDGMPVMAGKTMTEGYKAVFEGGLSLLGASKTGTCKKGTTLDNLQPIEGDPTLNFNVDLIYSCGLKMDFAEFQAFCNDAKAQLDSFDMFTNLQNFDSFGEFGNANMYYEKDWKTVSIDTSFTSFGSPKPLVDKTCTVFADVHYLIITSSMGFPQMPQNYIVSIQKSSSEQQWTYNRKTDTEK